MSCVTGWLFSCFFFFLPEQQNILMPLFSKGVGKKYPPNSTCRYSEYSLYGGKFSFDQFFFFSGFMWTVQWKHVWYQLLKFLMFQSQGNCLSIMILKCLLWVSAAMWRTTCFALTRCPNLRACCSLAPQYVCSAPFIHLVKFTVPSVKVYFCLLFVLMK